MGTLYNLLKSYLVDDYLETARKIIYTNREGFYQVINILCRVTTKQDYDNHDYLPLLGAFVVGLKLNEFNSYTRLVSEIRKDGSAKR